MGIVPQGAIPSIVSSFLFLASKLGYGKLALFRKNDGMGSIAFVTKRFDPLSDPALPDLRFPVAEVT
jgi:hypothetical protein